MSVPQEFNRETGAALEEGEAIAKGRIKAKRCKTVRALILEAMGTHSDLFD